MALFHLLFHSASDGYLYLYNRMICDRTLKVLNICQQLFPFLLLPPYSPLTSPESLPPFFPFYTSLLHPSPPPSSHTQIDAHQDDANAVTFADESSQIIFSGGDDGICKVWDRRSLSETHCNPVGILAGHKDGITFIDTKVCLLPHSHTHLLTQYSTRCHANTHAHTCTHSHKFNLITPSHRGTVTPSQLL